MNHPPRRAIPQPTNRHERWYRIENKANKDEAEVWIHGEIGGWWDGTSAQEFIDEIKDIKASRLKVHINSPGGSVFDGFAIYTALAEHPATVEARVDGMALSAASYIAMAGDEVNIAKTGTMMIHDGQGFALGNATDMREMADILDKLSDTIAGTYADRTGATVDEWRTRMRDETWYNAQEALDAGLVDSIRGKSGKSDDQDATEAAKVAASWDLSVFRYPGRDQAPAPSLRPAAVATTVTTSTNMVNKTDTWTYPNVTEHRTDAEHDCFAMMCPGYDQPATTEDPYADVPAEEFASLGAVLTELFDPMAGYDPEAMKTLIRDVYEDAPAPPTIDPGPPTPRTVIPIDELIVGITEGVRP